MTGGDVTLVEFLLARIAEDEAAARAALHIFGEPRWSFDEGVGVDEYRAAKDYNRHRVATADEHGSVLLTTPWEDGQPYVQHAARWDPARVLAECEAKRRIVTTMQTAIDQSWQDVAARPIIEFVAARTLRAIAAVYAGHPDFDPAWATERVGR